MPLLIPAVAAVTKWSKTNSGTVLSSFFWGYTLTQVMFNGILYFKYYKISILILLQVIGGYFSDRFGGQRVILYAAFGWGFITMLMPNIIWWAMNLKSYSIPFIVTVRIIHGALQGVHFPSMISLTSQACSI